MRNMLENAMVIGEYYDESRFALALDDDGEPLIEEEEEDEDGD